MSDTSTGLHLIAVPTRYDGSIDNDLQLLVRRVKNRPVVPFHGLGPYQGRRRLVDAVRDAAQGRPLDMLDIVAHGGVGRLSIPQGPRHATVDIASNPKAYRHLAGLSALFAPDATGLRLLGCNVGAPDMWKELPSQPLEWRQRYSDCSGPVTLFALSRFLELPVYAPVCGILERHFDEDGFVLDPSSRGLARVSYSASGTEVREPTLEDRQACNLGGTARGLSTLILDGVEGPHLDLAEALVEAGAVRGNPRALLEAEVAPFAGLAAHRAAPASFTWRSRRWTAALVLRGAWLSVRSEDEQVHFGVRLPTASAAGGGSCPSPRTCTPSAGPARRARGRSPG